MHGQIESLDKVEARREPGKPDHADFRDVGQGLVHLKPPEGMFQDSPEPGPSKGAPGFDSVVGPLTYVSCAVYAPWSGFVSPVWYRSCVPYAALSGSSWAGMSWPVSSSVSWTDRGASPTGGGEGTGQLPGLLPELSARGGATAR
jgi:hypothetical protein